VIALNAEAAALQARLLAGEKIPRVPLVHFALPVAQRWAVCGVPLVWGGFTWAPLDIEVTGLADKATQTGALQFTLPAVTPAELALAQTDVEGADVYVYMAWVDPATGVVADAKLRWAGQLDQPGWQDGKTAVAQFAARHVSELALAQRPTRYTNDEQLRLYPGDTSLNVDPLTDAPALVWPAASYFKQ
jgi:hypothetical protein